MEAATQLPLTHVRTRGGRLLVDGLVLDDECAVRLAAERERAGEDPALLVADAIEIGARVLDREQAAANTEFVKTEFERAARELDAEFVDRARAVAERLDAKIDEVFGPQDGHLSKALARHFGDDSSVAVQNRVRAAVTEVAAKMREDLTRQFSSDSENNPLAGFQKASLAVIRQTSDQQAQHLRAMTEKLEALKLELAGLRAERDKQVELAAAEERGTAKGRTYEEGVAAVLDSLAASRGDDCEAVGDAPGAAGKKGDILVSIDACSGPPRGRIVFEAKDDRSLSKNRALAYLDESLAGRDADYAVLVVPSDRLPARTQSLREFNGDKLFVAFDPEEGSTLALEVAYGLARARVLMRRGEAAGLDTDAVRSELERAQQAMEDVRRIKSQLTGATNGIEEARKLLDAMAASVRARLEQIDALLGAAEPAA
ncbi:MAG TPA: hypothetical protein VGY97_08900 [Solirubrobacteraceae bacterium]|jgi:hypothetical protein|nr:hypothetical protein [Solirubrobacteraceae bacterium]